MVKKFTATLAAMMFAMFVFVLPASALSDGTHSINYQVNQPASSTPSIANDYFVKPATVIAKGGKHTVQITLNNSSWITLFNPPGGAKVISEDKGADTRVVEFVVDDIAKPVSTKIKVDVEDINYHHEYTIDIVFEATNDGDTATTPGATTDKPDTTNTDGNTPQTNTTATPEKNPQTSDNAPYFIILALIGSGYLLYRNKKTKAEA